MKQEEILQKMSNVLLGDVSPQQADLELYPAFFIQRVLEYGDWHDWKLLLTYYGLDRIVKICQQLRSLDPVCVSFICTISNTQKEDYRCYRLAQSNPTLWNS